MNKINDNLQTRRSALKHIARCGLLAGLGALTIFAEAKRRRLLRQGKCISNSQCVNCEILNKCSLPSALSQKQKAGGRI